MIKALAVAIGIVLAGGNGAHAQVPAGMTPLLIPQLKGWHWSRINHHGTTAKAELRDGALYLSQQPYGQGGLLLTDKRYKNFELYLETDVPWGVNSGIFLRSSEGGAAYQIELTQFDGRPPNPGLMVGALFGEGVLLTTPSPPFDMRGIWKEGWNAFRIRVSGDAPTIAVWLNGQKLWEVSQTRNMKIGGDVDGKIGLQLHWTATYDPDAAKAPPGRSWRPGAEIGFRNIAIKELP